MQKISITLDLAKINKAKITDRTFDTLNGQQTAKEYKIDVIPLKEEKLIKEGDTWKMIKTHFVAEAQTKEERENGVKGTIIGDGIMFKDKLEDLDVNQDLGSDDIPF
jgi:hypothetical protein